MLYTTKMIQGEEAMKDLIRRMKGPNAKVSFCETIGHCDNITVQLHYMKQKGTEGYRPWYYLYMKHERGTISDLDDAYWAYSILIEGEEEAMRKIQFPLYKKASIINLSKKLSL